MNAPSYYVDNLSPFLVQFGPGIGIRYYGLAYLLAFVVAWALLRWQAGPGRRWLRLTPEQVDDFAFVAIPLGVIVGGRLGYCLLYDWPHTVAHPWTLFAVWEGGMASHGGLLGVIIAMLITARRYKIPFYHLADAAALATPLGLGLGRLANFINGELWGRPTTVPWAVLFPKAPLLAGQMVPRHPSQLYEAGLEGALLFLIVLLVRYKTRRDGIAALTFLAGYGILRILGETFREPDVQIGYYWGLITQGQLLSAIMIVAAIILAVLEFRPKTR